MSADLLAFQLKALKIKFEREVRFAPPRRWRLDFVIPRFPGGHLAIEVDGAVYSRGRHTRGKGFEGDCEKLNEATLLFYRVFRFSTGQVKKGEAIDTIQRALT